MGGFKNAGTSTEEVYGNGLTEGEFSNAWSMACSERHLVCGISTRVQNDQGDVKDDLGVTDFKLHCCKY